MSVGFHITERGHPVRLLRSIFHLDTVGRPGVTSFVPVFGRCGDGKVFAHFPAFLCASKCC